MKLRRTLPGFAKGTAAARRFAWAIAELFLSPLILLLICLRRR